MSKGIMDNGITTSEEQYYFDLGVKKGRADVIDELENILKDFFKKQNNPKSKFRPSIVMMEEDAFNILEQLKEQKND